MGYQRVYWYREGLKGWKQAGHPTDYTIKMMPDPPNPIRPEVLSSMLVKGEPFFLVDLRDDASRQQGGVIEGPSLHYPLYRLHSLYYELPKTKKLVFYDIRGHQAPTAARYMLQQGYPRHHITFLEGGIEAWQAAGFPVKQ